MVKNFIKGHSGLYRVIRNIKYKIIRPMYLTFYTAERCVAVNILPLSDNDKRFKSLHGVFSGKTAFIVGNGPSLKAKDLEMIRDAGGYCFATNRIHLIFKETLWRPNFYLAVDGAIIGDKTNTIQSVLSEPIDYYLFAPDVYDHMPNEYRSRKNVLRFHKKRNDLMKPVTEFSDDALKYVIDGYTATYSSMQMAYYFGFKRIVLIGVDCSYSNITNKDGTVTKNSNKAQYFSKEYDADNKNAANVIGMMEAYAAARKFSSSHNIEIYNATRGGELEIFERIPLEEICKRVSEEDGK